MPFNAIGNTCSVQDLPREALWAPKLTLLQGVFQGPLDCAIPALLTDLRASVRWAPHASFSSVLFKKLTGYLVVPHQHTETCFLLLNSYIVIPLHKCIRVCSKPVLYWWILRLFSDSCYYYYNAARNNVSFYNNTFWGACMTKWP